MPDDAEIMRALGRIEGTQAALISDVKDIKAKQETMNTAITTLKVKAAGVSAGVAFVTLAVGTWLKGFIARGGQ